MLPARPWRHSSVGKVSYNNNNMLVTWIQTTTNCHKSAGLKYFSSFEKCSKSSYIYIYIYINSIDKWEFSRIAVILIAFYSRPYCGRPCSFHLCGAPPWSSGSVLDYRSLPPVFESRRGHIWRLFRLSLRLITFGGRSAHLAYLVHKSGRKTSIIIIISLVYLSYQFVLIVIIPHYCRLFIHSPTPAIIHVIHDVNDRDV